MIIIQGAEFVKPVKKNMGRLLDGVFYKNGVFYITFIHGSESGFMQTRSKDAILTVSPQTVRFVIESVTGFKIGYKDKVVALPCHPYYVREKWGQDFKSNNFDIVGNWKRSTKLTVFDMNDRPLYNTAPAVGRKCSILLDHKHLTYVNYFSTLEGEIKGVVI